MGAFLLIKKPVGVDVEGVERLYKDSIGVFEKKGLPLNKRLVTDEFVIYAYHKYQHQVDNVVEFDNDQFIISTGTLIYNRKMGRDALVEVFHDFSEDGKFLSNILGEYSLVVSKKGRLFILNDYFGLSRIYTDKQKSVISNSFLAVFKSLKKHGVSVQELYEYFFCGTFYGTQTLINEIDVIDGRTIWQISPEVSAIPKLPDVVSLDSNIGFDEMVKEVSENLIDYFYIIKENFGDNVSLGLSGGHDSRLMLALLKKVGIKPSYLYVYDETDFPTCVSTATAIARGEGLAIEYVEVDRYPRVTADGFEAFLERQYYMNDGLTSVFNDGLSLNHRLERAAKAGLSLNGAGGEMYRNYYRLPQKYVKIETFIKSRFDIDFSMCSGRFDKNLYLSAFVDKIKSVLNISENRLSRRHISMLFPLWQIRYWMGDNNTVNNQISYSLSPFADIRFVFQSFDVPPEYRNFGVFETALIKYIDPGIAKYRSDYGYNFYDAIPLKAKIPDYIKLYAPVWLRAYIRKNLWNMTDAKLKLSRKQPDLPYYLSKEYRDRVFTDSTLNISEYIDIDKIRVPEILSRVLTAELVIDNRF